MSTPTSDGEPRPRRRARRAVPLVLGLVLAGGAPAAASDARWVGTIRCEPVPGSTETPLNVPATVTVRRGVARYERPIRSPVGGRTGLWERGEGPVAADGAVTLTGELAGRGWAFTARYAGVLAGAEATLSGAQVWDLEGGRRERPCTLALRRE